ncbi:hypothetical protein [Tsuneonella deserti]|uniref:hypothetical protein n=1 Tax=Tsuneonella deserti TaxID=2035528 RepID=UPI0016637C2C|nr:hypothetical protein [Tsuneonella deserti]
MSRATIGLHHPLPHCLVVELTQVVPEIELQHPLGVASIRSCQPCLQINLDRMGDEHCGWENHETVCSILATMVALHDHVGSCHE